MTAIQYTEPTLADLIADLRTAKGWIITGVIAALVAAFLFLILAVPQYRASVIVSPTTRSGTPDISALFPNNASFTMEYVMQSFGPSDSTDFMRFESIFRESSVAAVLLKDQRILDGIAQACRFRVCRHHVPRTAQELSAWLQDRVLIEPVSSTRLKRIEFSHPDPVFAVYLLQSLYDATDKLIRAELDEKTKKRVEYLKSELDVVQNPEHRRVLAKLLMDQEQILMILAVNEPFAANIAEAASASPRATWPRKWMIVVSFVLAGAIASYGAFVVRRALRAA